MGGSWEGRAPLTGVVAFVLFLLAFIIGGETPDFDASPTEALAFYVDHEGSQIAGSLLLVYASLFLIFFSATLRTRLRALGSEALSTMAMAGGVLMALGFLIFAGLTFTLADAGDALDPAAAQALNALNGDFFFPVAVGVSVLGLGAGLAILRGAALLPRWLGWAAIVLGVVAVSPGGFFALLAMGLWILIASIMMLRTPAPAAGTSPGAPTV